MLETCVLVHFADRFRIFGILQIGQFDMHLLPIRIRIMYFFFNVEYYVFQNKGDANYFHVFQHVEIICSYYFAIEINFSCKLKYQLTIN